MCTHLVKYLAYVDYSFNFPSRCVILNVFHRVILLLFHLINWMFDLS